MDDDLKDTLFSILKTIAGLSILVFGVYSCETSEWSKERDIRIAAERQARAIPHVIREADGCKVYAFERGGVDHYFTRCGAVVTTERNYSENCGKGCTRRKHEIITTEGNK